MAARARVAMLVLTLLSGACMASKTKSVQGPKVSSAFTFLMRDTERREARRRRREEEGKKRIFVAGWSCAVWMCVCV